MVKHRNRLFINITDGFLRREGLLQGDEECGPAELFLLFQAFLPPGLKQLEDVEVEDLI